MFRVAHEDDVLPLSTPITTTTGEVLTELPVPKGTRTVISIPAYNRLVDEYGSSTVYRFTITPFYIRNKELFGEGERLTTRLY